MSKLRVQAHRIGLIQPDNPESLKFCSESEASALYCYEQTQHLVMEKDDCFVMMDAGGGTVDFTSYKVTQTEPLKFEEIGISSRVCLFAGSTFVDRTFEEVLQVHLEEAYPDTEVKVRHLKRAMEYFVTKTKLDFNIQQQTPTFWDISSDDDDFDEGGIEVPWAVVEAAFAPHVARIIDAIIDIVKDIDKFKSKYLFCSGGFGDSPYLRQCLEKHAGPTLKVIQPEQTSSSSGSKAVSLGACIFGTSTVVSKRIVPYYIGIKTSHPASDGQIATHPRRLRIEHGVTRLTGIYSVIVKKNTSVSEGEYHSEAFTIDFGTKERSLTMMITIYTYGGNAPPQFADEAGVENTGYFRVMIPKHMKGQQMRNGAGVLIVRYTVDCRIYCGETELRSEIIMAGKKIGQSSFLNEGHGPTSAV